MGNNLNISKTNCMQFPYGSSMGFFTYSYTMLTDTISINSTVYCYRNKLWGINTYFLINNDDSIIFC